MKEVRGSWRGAGLSVVIASGAAGSCVAQCIPQWSAYPGPRLDHVVWSVCAWDPDGDGPLPSEVVAGGNFEHAGTKPLRFVGRFDGTAWRPMGLGVGGTVQSVTTFDPDGPGPLLAEPVIGGEFLTSGPAILNRIAAFRGGQWVPLGSGVGGTAVVFVNAMTAFENQLVIGGLFSMAGGVPVLGLARWNGSQWGAFPDERAGSPDVLATVNGSLYAGSSWIIQPGNPPLRNGLWRWDDPTWGVVGGSYLQEEVFAITTYRGQLAVAGAFFVALYDGAAWQMLGSGMNGYVDALCVFDPDGPGPMPELLIAGGSFSDAGGTPASGIAAWDGASWSPLGSGTTGAVRSMTVWNNQLVVAGEFFTAGGLVSPGMAFWGCPQPAPCYANCDGSTTSPALNVADFVCFMTSFAGGCPGPTPCYPNCDGSTTAPALNVADFICFINRYAAGCP